MSRRQQVLAILAALAMAIAVTVYFLLELSTERCHSRIGMMRPDLHACLEERSRGDASAACEAMLRSAITGACE